MEIEEFTELTVDVEAGVASVVLNRPERRNAWSGRMAVEYRWALYHAHTRDDIRVVVVSGAGGDFCVGADSKLLNSIADGNGSTRRSGSRCRLSRTTPQKRCAATTHIR